jgi:hypothetical protein
MWRIVLMVTVIGIGLSGCTFSRVDFKYSSIAHLSYKDAMTTVRCDPETLVFDLAEAFRRQGCVVLQRQELNYYLVENANAKACWEAATAIWKQEFDAYAQNSYSQYDRIDRLTPYTSRGVTQECRIFDEVLSDPKQSWLLMVQFPSRSANTIIYRPTITSFFVFNGVNPPIQAIGSSQSAESVGIDITTRLYIWAWRCADGRTSVYLEGRPFSGQVEAAKGNSIGWSWWKVSNGSQEADVVRSYLLLIQDYDRERSGKN